MALTLARDFGARVTGITLSSEQLAEARARAAAEGLSDRVRFEMLDYRSLPDQFARPFDRIVSVGMFEHVGLLHYRTFFRTVHRVLAPSALRCCTPSAVPRAPAVPAAGSPNIFFRAATLPH